MKRLGTLLIPIMAGSSIVGATFAAPSAEAAVHGAAVGPPCTSQVIVDRVDRKPRMYGGASIKCSFAGEASVQVKLYRGNKLVGVDLCSFDQSFSCYASVSAANPSGNQKWTAKAKFVYYQSGQWTWNKQEVTHY